MGVVRREGQWRLEKRDGGHYEITYERTPQATVITPDYNPGLMNDASFASIPLHEVGSYSEAEGLFEEHAHGGPPDGMKSISSGSSSPISFSGGGALGFDLEGGDGDGLGFGGGDENFLKDAENLPLGGVALAFLLTGGLVLSVYGFAPSEPVFLVAAGMAGLGVAIVAWAGVLFQTRGWQEAVAFLVTVDEEDPSSTETSSDSRDEPKTTPPAPEKLKNELIFGRSKQSCEWCGISLDNPEVHHISPRTEGGPNEPTNLIVLCPTCHRKADQGGISKTKLRAKLRHILGEQG